MTFDKDKKILNYMLSPGNEEFFVQILNDCKENNYTQLSRKHAYYDYSSVNGIKSLIMINHGSCYYIDVQDEHYDWMKRLIEPELKSLFFCYFKEETFNRLQNDIHYPFRDVFRYHTMKLEKSDFTPLFLDESEQKHIIHTLWEDDVKCRRLDINDFGKIKSLQYDYHIEEVYGSKANYPYRVEMENLKKSLKNQIYFGIFINGMAVAKANVNAESKNVFQIGGVFTNKKFRKKHLSAHCLSALLTECFKTKSSVSLYVKQDNKTAIDLYTRLGFKTVFNSVLCYSS